MSSPDILLCYLQAGNRFGPTAGRINERFCRDTLGINNPLAAAATLRRLGYRVEISSDGNINLVEEVLQ